MVLGMWTVLSVHCRAAETNSDENFPQTVETGRISTTRNKRIRNADGRTEKLSVSGSFEDTFDYVDKNGVRRGYGSELCTGSVAGYAGWKFKYVKCDWSNCFDMLESQ